MSPRWRKVLGDLWVSKARTALVVLSIAVGVFAVGMTSASRVILPRELAAEYDATRPSSAMIYTNLPFDDDFVDGIRRMRDVRDAQGRGSHTVRLQAGPDEWREFQLFAIPDYTDVRINKVTLDAGTWPPPEHTVLIERSSAAFARAHAGDRLTVKMRDGRVRQLRVAGIVHDLSQFPTPFIGIAYGYVTRGTAEWLGGLPGYNELYIVTLGDTRDRAHVEQVTKRVQDRVEKAGLGVFQVRIDAGKHWADDSLRAMALLLSVLGGFSLLLSGFLVVNTISALLAQQIRQIGIMKAVGARRAQIMAMYLATVFVYSLLALLVAVPLGVLGASRLSAFTAGFLNFTIRRAGLPPQTLALEIGSGLIVPLLAAVVPVIVGARITVREALGSYGLAGGEFGGSGIDRLVERVRGLSRPLALSLRNTVRRKGRLGLTLATLTLAGAIFIGVFSVRASLMETLAVVFRQWDSDVWVRLEQSYRVDRIAHEARQVPGVARTEGWRITSARRVRPDGAESDNVFVYAPPAETNLFHPALERGRWLLPQDERAVVVSTDLLENERDIRVGGDLVLKVGDRKRTFRVVGIVRTLLTRREPGVYVNYPSLAQLVGGANRTEWVQVVTDRHDAAFQARVARALSTSFEHVGIRIRSAIPMGEQRARNEAMFNVIVGFLLVMAVLLAVVGGLGLMGTMSINVLERTREIGVMRAIGASTRAVVGIVIVEGTLIGAISWGLAVLLSVPLSLALSRAVGMVFLGAPLAYRFSLGGVVEWLGLALVLSAVASVLPAWNASRLTVRDVLAYE